MPYDTALATRVREHLATHGFTERAMFGGLCFLVNGHMVCGVTSELMVRVGKDAYEAALADPHARPMDFTGRPLAGYVYVAAEGTRTRAALGRWLERAVGYVGTLPAKAPKKLKAPKKATAKRR